MLIYCSLLVYWFVTFHTSKIIITIRSGNIKLHCRVYKIIVGSSLFLLMALRDKTVGVDTIQYLFRYNDFPVKFTGDAFKGYETLFYSLSTLLKNLGISEQGYLAIIAFIISISFVLFYSKYSKNMFLSFFLYVTLGALSINMSALRQSVAICIIITFSFKYLLSNKLFKFVCSVLVAALFHTSALVFLPIYFLRNIIISQKRGLIIIIVTLSALVFRLPLSGVFEHVIPARYTQYGLVNELNPLNPLVILASIAVPVACLILWRNVQKLNRNELRLFSILYILSCTNAFISIMALNSSMIARFGFYFMVFNMILIPNIIELVKDKGIRLFALYLCILLPLIQFILTTPAGTLAIGKYSFFWQ